MLPFLNPGGLMTVLIISVVEVMFGNLWDSVIKAIHFLLGLPFWNLFGTQMSDYKKTKQHGEAKLHVPSWQFQMSLAFEWSQARHQGEWRNFWMIPLNHLNFLDWDLWYHEEETSISLEPSKFLTHIIYEHNKLLFRLLSLVSLLHRSR